MVYSHARYESFAMKAEEAYDDPSLKTGTGDDLYGVDVSAVGRLLNLSPEDSEQFALMMQDERWAVLSGQQGRRRLRLTRLGHEEIAKLRRAAWRKWIARLGISFMPVHVM